MGLTFNDKLIMLIAGPKEFSQALPSHCRVLALDVGEKTIGLALSDTLRRVASPYDTIRRGKFAKDAESLQRIIKEQNVGGLVIGYPVNMDGSKGPRTQSTRTFAANLGKLIGLPMLLWDERMTTMAVERVMLGADLSRKRRGELVDKLAASYMLQGFLDSISS